MNYELSKTSGDNVFFGNNEYIEKQEYTKKFSFGEIIICNDFSDEYLNKLQISGYFIIIVKFKDNLNTLPIIVKIPTKQNINKKEIILPIINRTIESVISFKNSIARRFQITKDKQEIEEKILENLTEFGINNAVIESISIRKIYFLLKKISELIWKVL